MKKFSGFWGFLGWFLLGIVIAFVGGTIFGGYYTYTNLELIDGDNDEAGTCIVSFDTNGGTAIEALKVKPGTVIEKPQAPIREGFFLIGWYDSADFTKEFDFNAPIKRSCTVYARWLDVNDATDTDGDGLTDPIEEFYGTDKNVCDTDGDGLSDYVEIVVLSYDPLSIDTDKDGVNDGIEDADDDTLSNLDEVRLNTNPVLKDTDADGLFDNDEVNIYFTDPTARDTDGDGVSDGKEIELGTDPFTAQSVFAVEVSTNSAVSGAVPSVKLELSGDQVETLTVEPVKNETFFPDEMPGYMGQAYDFSVEGEFTSAEISFEFDASLIGSGIDPVIYYFNEETQELEELVTVVVGNVATATVEHFSKYILINRKVYNDTFEWVDVWDSTTNYTGVEVVMVIDDSGSLGGDYSYDSVNGVFYDGMDPTHQRLEVARDFVSKANTNFKIGVIKFDSGVVDMSGGLVECDESGKNNLKDILKFSYGNGKGFDSKGSTYMYTGIDAAMDLYTPDSEHIMKVMIVFTDGQAHDAAYHNSVINDALDNNIRIYTVGLGNSSNYFDNYLKPLANSTGGVFYEAEKSDQLAEIYQTIKEKIDIETDSDEDGIPDYYEDNMIFFNGVKLTLDKNNPDTDGDGLMDGEEVELKYEYNADRTQVKVTGKIIGGDPTKVDTDGDRFTDDVDAFPYEWDVSDRDLAMFSQIVYQDIPLYTKLGSVNEKYSEMANEIAEKFDHSASIDELQNWFVLDAVYNNNTGMQAAAYINGKNIVVAYRGSELSEFKEDWVIADVIGFCTGLNWQVPYANRFIEQIMKKFPSHNIYITGHSLGGNLAYNAGSRALLVNANAVKKINVYNGLGLLSGSTFGLADIVDKVILWKYEDIVSSYRVEGDVVSALPNTLHYGKKPNVLLCEWVTGWFSTHALHSFLDKRLTYSNPNGIYGLMDIIEERLVEKAIPDECYNENAIGYLQIDTVEYWPDEIVLSSSGKLEDGREWKKYYFERTYYATKQKSYLICIDNSDNTYDLYLMYAKAGSSVLGGSSDEIYRKVELSYLSNGKVGLKCKGGSAIAVMANAFNSYGNHCDNANEADPNNFLYWDASSRALLSVEEWRDLIHYSERFELNDDENLPNNVVEALAAGFVKLPASDSKYHQENDKLKEYELGYCLKYVHNDGREAIYYVVKSGQNESKVNTDPAATQLITLQNKPLIGPTFNYSPNDYYELSWQESMLKVRVASAVSSRFGVILVVGSEILEFAYSKTSHSSIAHYYFDMLPYYWWGNVSGN